VKRPPGGRRQFVETAGWRASSSPEYEKMPHEYTVRGKATAGKTVPVEWFDWFRYMIRKHGYKAPFTNVNTGRTYVYVYMNFEGFKYWAFQIIINREPLPASARDDLKAAIEAYGARRHPGTRWSATLRGDVPKEAP